MKYKILIVEDEYWTAQSMMSEAHDRGASVIGPVSSVPGAIELLSGTILPDVCILDIHLRNEKVFPLADALRRMGIPFVFATGSDRGELPSRFSDIPHLLKMYTVKDGFEGACVEAALALVTPGDAGAATDLCQSSGRRREIGRAS